MFFNAFSVSINGKVSAHLTRSKELGGKWAGESSLLLSLKDNLLDEVFEKRSVAKAILVVSLLVATTCAKWSMSAFAAEPEPDPMSSAASLGSWSWKSIRGPNTLPSYVGLVAMYSSQ